MKSSVQQLSIIIDLIIIGISVHRSQINSLELLCFLSLESLWHCAYWWLALSVTHLRRTVVLGRSTITNLVSVVIFGLRCVDCEAFTHTARIKRFLRFFGWALRIILWSCCWIGRWVSSHWYLCWYLRRTLTGSHWHVGWFLVFGLCCVLLTILPLIDLLKNAVLVHFLEFSIETASLWGVGHYDFVEDELLNNILIDSVLLKLKVIIIDGLTFNDLVIIIWVEQLFQEWMLENLLCGESLLWVISEQLLH